MAGSQVVQPMLLLTATNVWLLVGHCSVLVLQAKAGTTPPDSAEQQIAAQSALLTIVRV